MLLGKGYKEHQHQQNFSLSSDKIVRVDHVQESTNLLELHKRKRGSWNVTNYEKSNNHAKFLNKTIDANGVRIDEERVIGNRYSSDDKVSDEKKIFYRTPESYKKFKQSVVSKFSETNPENKIFALISHSKFLEQELDIPHLSNLDSVLVRYKVNENGEVIKQSNNLYHRLMPEQPYSFNEKFKDEIIEQTKESGIVERIQEKKDGFGLDPQFLKCDYTYSEIQNTINSKTKGTATRKKGTATRKKGTTTRKKGTMTHKKYE